ncbi:hypothetical protein Kpho02_39850 [Kitasatospora phosalacinea]|uniref:RDD domain-containing protein n=1 Tax=Kitasatospora phosalacinea TaxID=2065 RepID=A0A9W6V1H7_9ACTN|nr:RDD family protein [Kitasatospora phosalacinea]GLW71686.1 hypothetical protein Kpho02_39850 [Kitasatospora phosalacinea]
MTDRPSTAGSMPGATLAGDAGAPGYYPDPSVPGFVRYWAGHAWVPGTSRPAPAPGEPLDPPRFVARYLTAPPYGLPPGPAPANPAPANPAAAGPGAGAGAAAGVSAGSVVETGPIYLDETGAQALFTMPVHPGAGGPGAGGDGAGGDGVTADAAAGGAADSGPGALEVRPRSEVESLRPVEVAPWAVAGNGLQPVAAESWATAAALHLGSGGAGVPVGAVVAPRKGRDARDDGRDGARSGRGARSAREVREVEAAARPLELAGPAVTVEPESGLGAAMPPRAAQPLGGTPWHGAAAGEGIGGGDGSVGLVASPGALFEPVPSAGPAESEPPVESVEPVESAEPGRPSAEPRSDALPQPRSADSASGWRADPRAQRGLMETGGAPRWVSWGVDPEPGAGAGGAPVPEQAPATVEAERPGREPRAAHVTSERVRPPRRDGGPGAAEGAAPAAAAAATTATATATATTATAAASAKKRRTGAPAPVPAGVGARALAWLVDGAVTAVVGAAVAVPLAGTVRAHVQSKIDQAALVASMTGRQRQVWLLDGTVLGRVGVLLGVLLVFGLLYQVLPIARTGQTFGKRLARVRVVAAGGTGAPGFGRSLLRWLVRGLGTVVLLGPLAALLDRPARRGWHDRVARTRAVRAERG